MINKLYKYIIPLKVYIIRQDYTYKYFQKSILYVLVIIYLYIL